MPARARGLQSLHGFTQRRPNLRVGGSLQAGFAELSRIVVAEVQAAGGVVPHRFRLSPSSFPCHGADEDNRPRILVRNSSKFSNQPSVLDASWPRRGYVDRRG